MRRMNLLGLVAVLVSAAPALADPTLNLTTTGTTDTVNVATAGFALTGLKSGQALDPVNWYVSMMIGDFSYDVNNTTTKQANGGTQGTCTGSGHAVTLGKHTVTIKVKLNDGTFVTGTGTVTFKPTN